MLTLSLQALFQEIKDTHCYDPQHPLLQEARQHAREQCQEFNQLSPSAIAAKRAILTPLLKRITTHSIESEFNVEYGQNCALGKAIFINHNVTIIDVCSVTIGNQVLIGPNTVISTAVNRFALNPTQQETVKPVSVGHRVWIGANVKIGAGVSLGDNCVIGAGSTVLHDIPANAIAFGNPAVCRRKVQQNTQ